MKLLINILAYLGLSVLILLSIYIIIVFAIVIYQHIKKLIGGR